MDTERSGPTVRVTIDDVARAAGVSRQKYELGRTLVEALDGVVHARRDDAPAPVEHRLLPATLVVRRSA
jgi:DNA-binding LacI/PurR family transcriptional regulator